MLLETVLVLIVTVSYLFLNGWAGFVSDASLVHKHRVRWQMHSICKTLGRTVTKSSFSTLSSSRPFS